MTIPSIIRPAFSAISPSDHAGYLWIIVILGDIYTVLASFVRVFIKWGVFGLDDYLIGLATVSVGALPFVHAFLTSEVDVLEAADCK